MTLLLSRADVEAILPLSEAIALTREALLEQAAGTAVAVPPRHVAVGNGGALRIVAGALLGADRMGVRVGPAAALASSRATALLYDATSGDLLSVMAYPFGTVRTGAAIGLATRVLAREDARQLAMIGTGRNALSLIEAVCAVRPIEAVRVYSRTPERRERLAREAAERTGRAARAAESSAEAVRGADVVCVATDSATPVIERAALADGAFVATMGRPSEMDPDVYRAADLIVVGHRRHEEQYFDVGQYRHRLLELVKSGELSWDGIHELSEIVAGQVPGRTSPSQTIVFKESQGGFGDIAFADYVYQEARRQGRGQEVQVQ